MDHPENAENVAALREVIATMEGMTWLNNLIIANPSPDPAEANDALTSMSATFHTTAGDIKVELNTERCPKTCELADEAAPPSEDDALMEALKNSEGLDFIKLCMGRMVKIALKGDHRNLYGYLACTDCHLNLILYDSVEAYKADVNNHRSNFLALCASNYYNGCIFHRNIKDFMVQTGDQSGTGKGGNSIWGEPFQDELDPELKHDARGILSMANNGPDSNKSQFFITYAAHPHLDLKHTVFGKVIDGFDTLDELENTKVDHKYRPVVEQRIKDPLRAATNSSSIFKPVSTSSVVSSPVRLFSTPSVPKGETEVDLKRVEQMQQYFNQYVDEYYEVEEAAEEEEAVEEAEPKSDVKQSEEEVELRHLEDASVDEIVAVLEQNRAIDITCVDIPLEAKAPHRHMIICSPYNSRHAEALTNVVRQYVKENFYFEGCAPRRVRSNGGWFVFDMHQIVIHVLTEELRAKYALETLWTPEDADGENDDDMIPPPEVDAERI